MREDLRCLCDLPELTVEILDRIRRVDCFANGLRIAEEWSDIGPSRLPAFKIRLVLWPSVHHFFESIEPGFLARSIVDRFKLCAELLLVFGSDEHDCVSDLMHDADLHVGVRVHRFDCFRESFQSINASDKDVIDSAILEIVQDMHPEFSTFRFADPYTKHLLLAKPRTSTMPMGVSVAVSNESRIKNLEQAIDDVLKAYTDCEPFADYVTINISCPNAELGQLFLNAQNLNQLLVQFNKIRTTKPVFIKMAPDLTSENVDEILNCIMHHKIDGIVCTNLTKKYSRVSQDDELHKGGVSGKAVAQQSKDLLRYVYAKTQGSLICISSGGVFSAQDAYERIRSGASLVQVLTALIYEGPQVIADMNRELDKLLVRDGFTDIQQAIGVDALK